MNVSHELEFCQYGKERVYEREARFELVLHELGFCPKERKKKRLRQVTPTFLVAHALHVFAGQI